MAQVQIEFSKIAASDLSGQARIRVASAPGTHDFASMIDAASNDGSAVAAQDTHPARTDRYSERSSSRSVEPSAPSTRVISDRTDRADTTSSLRDDSRPHTADHVADKAQADGTSNPSKTADDRKDSDQSATSTDSNGDPAAAPAATSETVPATAPVIAPMTQPSAPAPDGATAEEPTIVDAVAATTAARSGMQPSDTEAARDDAHGSQATDASRLVSAALSTALPQKKPGGETAAAADAETAPAELPEADAAPETSSSVQKTGKDGRVLAESAQGEAAVTTPAGEETAADQQPQPLQPDDSDAAQSHDTKDSAHKDAQANADGAASKSGKTEGNDTAAPVRSDEPRAGAIHTLSHAGSPSTATPASAHTGFGAVGGASGVNASVTTAAAPASRSDAASAAVPLTDVGVEIASHAKAGRHSFDIRLDPPELGHIHVRLDIDRDGNVISRLVVDRAETLDLLRRDAPQLERALQDAGLKADSQTMQFSLRDQNAGQQDGQNHARAEARPADPDAAPRRDEISQNYGRLSGRSGGIDIRI